MKPAFPLCKTSAFAVPQRYVSTAVLLLVVVFAGSVPVQATGLISTSFSPIGISP